VTSITRSGFFTGNECSDANLIAMPLSRDPGALLSRSYELPSGPRVRLRLARRSDLPGVRALLAQRGIEANDLELERLVRYDPRKRVAICAMAPVRAAETVVGVGAIDLESDAEPETIVVDERLTHGLGTLLAETLAQRAQIHARRIA
jgi:hypothetical protein